MSNRALGVVAPVFSLRRRGDWGIGDTTALAAFGVWAKTAGVSLVQVLPPHALFPGETSPYAARSAFALDPIYIDCERVLEVNATMVEPHAAAIATLRERSNVAYDEVRAIKEAVLEDAFEKFVATEWAKDSARAKSLRDFVKREEAWLIDFAAYAALRSREHHTAWACWPQAARDRDPSIVAAVKTLGVSDPLGRSALAQMYRQWIAFTQWDEARATVRAAGVELMGDLPFIVGTDSADVWAHPREFVTDVSLGAPPDDFSAEGQDWGLPAYDWDSMDENGLAWLRARAKHAGRLYDRFRLDHVVGFFRMWLRKHGGAGEFSPATEPEQVERGRNVLSAMIDAAKPSRIIAEDLGVIPAFVHETLRALELPGYRIIPWDRDQNFVLRKPQDAPPISVTAFSTHDTAPMLMWWPELKDWEREQIGQVMGVRPDAPPDELERALFHALGIAGSDLSLVLLPELLGENERINFPGTVGDHNWTYRMKPTVESLEEQKQQRYSMLHDIMAAANRLG